MKGYTNTDKIMPKNATKYYCEKCDFKCSKLSNYNNHLSTQKHNRLINTDEGTANFLFYCKCGKKYKHSQSLYNHKKKCTFIENLEDEKAVTNNIITNAKVHVNDNDISYKKMFIELMNENKEMRLMMQEQQKQMNEILPKIGNNNTTNNKFNIMVFLNEKCKNAISMTQFIEKIEISMKNLLTTKDKGLSEGISNIIIDNMNQLSLYERPLHCTDKKRETLYIKNDEWQKDERKELMNDLLKKVEHKQMKNIKQWTDEHPDYMDDEKLQDEYINLVRKCTSSVEECKNKVIKKVCDNVYLTDKE